MKEHRFILTGGGTGGHVTPAIALGMELKAREPGARFLYVGTRKGKEAEIVPRYGFALAFVQSHQWQFHRKWHLLRFAWKMACGTLKSAYLVMRFRPDAVIGTGGYVAAPVVFANLLLRWVGLSHARTIIHEQNMTPGKLNALVGRVADLVLVSFSETAAHFRRAAYVGYPVRADIFPADPSEAKRRLGIPAESQVVLVFGGSMGARTINRAIIDALPLLKGREGIRVIHGTGRKLSEYDPVADCDLCKKQVGLGDADLAGWYESHEFIDHIGDYYSAADLVVCRSGAGTIAELCACGRAGLLIPKANLPGDHQVLNALEMVRHGAAEILYEDAADSNGLLEEHVSGSELARKIVGLLDNGTRRHGIASNAAKLAPRKALSRSIDAIQAQVDPSVAGLELETGTPTRKDATPEGEAREFERAARLSGENLRAFAETTVAKLRQHLERDGGTTEEREHVISEALDRNEMVAYLRYRAAAHLTSDNWRTRNAGVKMVGILRQREKLPILIRFVKDRRPARLLQRALGGDFETNGFIRRNSVVSIVRLAEFSDSVRDAIVCGFSDPYFEVRTQSARAVQAFRSQFEGDAEVNKLLQKMTEDRYFEVVVEATRALGWTGSAGNVLPALNALSLHGNWRVREAVVDAYCALMDRGQEVPKPVLRVMLSAMMVTSTGFAPSFSLKLAVSRLGGRINRQDTEEGTGGGT